VTTAASPADASTHTQTALRRLLDSLGEVTGVEVLTGGMFATRYRVCLTDGSRVIAKTAPADTDRLLT
jgi:uncharacterized membrane-anchored protein